MLRHCTVTAVKTNITRVSCPPLEQSEGRTYQERTETDVSMGVQWGCPGITNVTDRRFVQISPQFYFDF